MGRTALEREQELLRRHEEGVRSAERSALLSGDDGWGDEAPQPAPARAAAWDDDEDGWGPAPACGGAPPPAKKPAAASDDDEGWGDAAPQLPRPRRDFGGEVSFERSRGDSFERSRRDSFERDQRSRTAEQRSRSPARRSGSPARGSPPARRDFADDDDEGWGAPEQPTARRPPSDDSWDEGGEGGHAGNAGNAGGGGGGGGGGSGSDDGSGGRGSLFASGPDRVSQRLFADSLLAHLQVGSRERHARKIRRLVELITVDLVQSALLSPARVREMQEHPDVARYLMHGFVALKRSSRLFRVVGVVKAAEAGAGCPFDLRISSIGNEGLARGAAAAGGAAASADGDGSTVAVSELAERVVTQTDVDTMSDILLRKLRDVGALETWVKTVERHRRQLRKFTFTEADVQEILQRKAAQAAPRDLSYRACCQRLAEVETRIEQSKSVLTNPRAGRAERREANDALRELELELHQLRRRVEAYQAAAASPPAAAAVGAAAALRAAGASSAATRAPNALFIQGGGGGFGRAFRSGTAAAGGAGDAAAGVAATPAAPAAAATAAPAAARAAPPPSALLNALIAVLGSEEGAGAGAEGSPPAAAGAAGAAGSAAGGGGGGVGRASLPQSKKSHAPLLLSLIDLHTRFWAAGGRAARAPPPPAPVVEDRPPQPLLEPLAAAEGGA